jgi:hypothetical protein
MSSENQLMIGIGAVGVAVVGVALDNLVALPIDETPHFGRFFGYSFLCAGLAAAIFLLLVPWAQREPQPGARLAQSGFALALAGLATMVVFFTGVPLVLGAGAFVLGRLAEEQGTEGHDQPGERRRQDDTQRAAAGAEQEPPSPPASLGWATAVMGALVFAACVVLLVILVAA